MSDKLCNVAVAVPLRTTFTYKIPARFAAEIQTGSRVLVPFRKKSTVGVVVEFVEAPPAGTKLREIQKSLDAVPALNLKLLELGKWIASYYVAPIGEVCRAMLPPLTELQAQQRVVLTDAGRTALDATLAASSALKTGFSLQANPSAIPLQPRESLTLFQQLKPAKTGLLLAAVIRSGIPLPDLLKLQRRGLLEIRQDVQDRKRRMQRIVAWKESPGAETSKPLPDKEQHLKNLLSVERGPLPLPQLLKLSALSRTVVDRLIREGKLEYWEEPLDPAEDPFDIGYTPPAHALNPEQERAFSAIRARFELREFGVQLLHGVTGSGKTEIYLRAVQDTLARGKTAIVMVPEIALTLWIGRQCRAWFGAHFEGVAVLHSALSDVERAREWWRVRNGEARVVVGTRSAIFAPVENLGLIIVDEEQESSYKQEETPRYHGRDVAIVRAKLENAVALLGSATPSLETYHHARSGKYELLSLTQRVADRSLPSVEIVDLREDFKQTHRTSPISSALRKGIEDCLAFNTQALILINRRGYSWSVICRSCGASVQCANCSISMTHHKYRNRLECHYCGYTQSIPKKCPKCDSQYVYFFGEGSEQFEERLRKEFPKARVARLDRDTARTKRQFQETLGAFAEGALDILVGTQMVAKGHDFHRVTLVGVVGADGSLNMPDFRAAERTFQLLTQVAGRAGRGDLPGRVLIQTFYPDHYAIQDAVKQDYAAFFERELHFRRVMAYPPFISLANVIIHDRSLDKAIKWSTQLSQFLAPHAGNEIRVLGPASAPLSRLKSEYRFQFLLKSRKKAALAKLLSAALAYADSKQIQQTALVVDMDPLQLL
ncbi:MAG TPA: primosomal protein N' [Candidatus Eisenbacteria bacterium]|jgi:primosomal protein N' (replication factor Y)|nr:primosomal protein N' [Candidatus Eisenbacteria bacterium]